MRLFSRAALAAIVISLTACAGTPQTPIELTPATLAGKTRIGVVMAKLPKVDVNLPGASCLLCIAAASVANSSLTTHTQTLGYEDLPKLNADLAQALTKKGQEAVVIDEPLNLETLPDATKGPNLARKDFSSLKKKYGVEKLVVVELTTLGMERSYSAYIPNGPPHAIFAGSAYLVNLSSNTYEWYRPIKLVRETEGKWDEPPKFPGLTNAYFQVIELGKDDVLKPFKAQ